jgi:ankyrin repeat protein
MRVPSFLIFLTLILASCVGSHQPALHKAAKAGDYSKVRSLLGSGGNPDELGVHDWTALMWAANRGHMDIVKTLLDAGANPDLKSKRITGNTMAPYPVSTALREAVDHGHVDIANLLMDRGAKVDQTAFAMAAGVGNLDLMQRMLDKGADVNKPSENPYNPSAMVVACSKGNVETVKWLVSKGADAKNAPLKPTLKGGNAELLQLIIEAGADLNQISGHDATSPLQHAVILHTYGVRHDPGITLVKLLLANGADPSYAGSTGQFSGKTALELLKDRRNRAAARSNDSNFHEKRRNYEAKHVKKMDELIQILESHQQNSK